MAATDVLTDEQFDRWLADASRGPATVVGLDLTARPLSIADEDLGATVFVGCQVTGELAARLAAQGCSVLGEVDALPIPVGRRDVYRVAELYGGFDPAEPGSWSRTLDHRGWQWFIDPDLAVPRTLDTAGLLGARIHDAMIEAALGRCLRSLNRPVVGVMGGHDTARSNPLYADIARFAREVTRRGRLILTGGGPGLMEAANLGAFLAPYDDAELEHAMATLRPASDYTSHEWLATACAVRTRLLGAWRAEEEPASCSIGVPTWLYGHEPPNLFATHSAKLFFNAVREDGLVTIADGGILFAEGNAGTVQELFQDATQNYYRPSGPDAPPPTPMVLFGRDYWSRPAHEPPTPDPTTGTITDKRKPLLPLLGQLAAEKAFADAILVTSDLEAALDHLAPRPVEAHAERGLAWRRAD